jgi:oxygen-independent coproporphyrinogen III oxidase
MPITPAPLPRLAPMGIYIHIPFCSHICPYCDFATYSGKEGLIPRYVDALVTDLARQSETVRDREIVSIFIGGGTPSLLDGDQMRRILDVCRASYRLLDGCEISVETNPNSVDRDKLGAWHDAGVNRLSIGAQTLDRGGLRRLGRQHEASDVHAALAAARDAGFERVSVDLIFGWPGQTLDSWRHDLATLLASLAAPNHLSLYSLIVEPGTPYADMQARGILPIPDDDATADMYELAVDVLRDAGWTHYEIANWTRDPEHWSRHNALYWQHGDYLGAGAGAHGHLDGVRTMNHLLPETWMTAVAAGESPVSNTEPIDRETSVTETVLMGLRLLTAGISDGAFAARHGVSLRALAGDEIDRMAQIGLIAPTGDGIRLTERGALLSNEVIARLTDFERVPGAPNRP